MRIKIMSKIKKTNFNHVEEEKNSRFRNSPIVLYIEELESNTITDETMQRVLKAKVFIFHNVTEKAAQILFPLLLQSKTNFHLDFTECNIIPEVAKCLADFLSKTSSLTSISFELLHEESGEIIGDGLLRNRSITSMYARICSLNDKTYSKLAEWFKTNPPLTSINLSDSNISCQSHVCLAQSCKHNTNLRSLELAVTGCTPKGITAWVETLHFNETIEHLGLYAGDSIFAGGYQRDYTQRELEDAKIVIREKLSHYMLRNKLFNLIRDKVPLEHFTHHFLSHLYHVETINVNIDLPTGSGNTLLIAAEINNRQDIKNLLIEKGFFCDSNIDKKDRQGKTVLMHSIEQEDMLVFNDALSKEANLNLQDNKGNTALHIALIKANEASVNALIDKGINVYIKNKEDLNALELIEKLQSPQYINITQTLLTHHKNNLIILDKYKMRVGHDSNDIDAIIQLINLGLELQKLTYNGQTILEYLIITAINQRIATPWEIVLNMLQPFPTAALKYLNQQGDPVLQALIKSHGYTDGLCDVIDYLLNKDMSILSYPNQSQQTALDIAIQRKNYKPAVLLMNKDRNSKLNLDQKKALFSLAANHNDITQMIKLINEGVELTTWRSSSGETILEHLITVMGQQRAAPWEIVLNILQPFPTAALKYLNWQGNPVLQALIKSHGYTDGLCDVIDYLLNKDMSILSYPNQSQQTALDIAIQRKNYKPAVLLMNKDRNSKLNLDQKKALFSLAANHNDFTLMIKLINEGIEPTAIRANGQTSFEHFIKLILNLNNTLWKRMLDSLQPFPTAALKCLNKQGESIFIALIKHCSTDDVAYDIISYLLTRDKDTLFKQLQTAISLAISRDFKKTAKYLQGVINARAEKLLFNSTLESFITDLVIDSNIEKINIIIERYNKETEDFFSYYAPYINFINGLYLLKHGRLELAQEYFNKVPAHFFNNIESLDDPRLKLLALQENTLETYIPDTFDQSDVDNVLIEKIQMEVENTSSHSSSFTH